MSVLNCFHLALKAGKETFQDLHKLIHFHLNQSGYTSWLFFHAFEVNFGSCIRSHMEPTLVDKTVYPHAVFVLSYFYPGTINFFAAP